MEKGGREKEVKGGERSSRDTNKEEIIEWKEKSERKLLWLLFRKIKEIREDIDRSREMEREERRKEMEKTKEENKKERREEIEKVRRDIEKECTNMKRKIERWKKRMINKKDRGGR